MMVFRSACGVSLFLIVTTAALGAEASRPETDDPRPQGLGQLLIQDTQSGSPVRLNVARYHVNVVLQPPVALVQIDQAFYNPFDRQQEGQFVFNLPRGASVSRFAMYVTPTELIEGELIERQRAAEIYDSIVRRRRDPAILEQIGDNLFKMRVFPIFARDEKRILLDFTLPLEPQDGRYEFRLPLFSDLQPIWDFRLTGTVRGAIDAASLNCVSHPEMRFQPADEEGTRLQFAARNYRPKTDLVLEFAQASELRPTLRSYVVDRQAEDPDASERGAERRATYFLAEIPPEPVAEPSPPVDVLLLLDTSSSSGDLQAIRTAARDVVSNLRVDDCVRLVCLDVLPRPLHEGWLPGGRATDNVDPESGDRRSIAAVLRRLDEQFALGSTDLDACLRETMGGFDDRDTTRRRLVIYIGDGVDASSQDQQIMLAQGAGLWFTRYQAALIGTIVRSTDQPQDYLRLLVEHSGGMWFSLAGNIHGHQRWERWLQNRLPSPRKVDDVRVQGAAGEDLYWPRSWPADEPLRIHGRMRGDRRVKLAVELERGGETVTRHWTLSTRPGQEDVFVGRLWAQQRLQQLRRVDDERPETRREIVALSQEWSLLSPHTAFLVLETEADYARWEIDRRVRHRYWQPPDARLDAPLPPNWLAAVTPVDRPQVSDAQFQEALQQAEEDMQAGRHAEAQARLQSVAASPLASRSERFARLRRRAADGVRAEHNIRTDRGYRDLFQPASSAAAPNLRPDILALVRAAFRASPEFLRRHPHAEALMREASLSSLGDERTLEQFARRLSELTGAHVMLDRRALDDVGIPADRPMTPVPWRRLSPPALPSPVDPADPFAMSPAGRSPSRRKLPKPEDDKASSGPKASIRSCVRHLLRPLELVLVEQPHRLLITTPEEAEELLTTEVYPVADLLFTDRVAPLSLLSHPYLDRELLAEKRIEARLNRPIELEVSDQPLEAVVADLQKALGELIVLDERAMDDIGLSVDVPVSVRCRDVPAAEALRWLLEPLELTCTIDDEALVVTTRDAVENRLQVRLHPARGVLYEFPAEIADRLFSPAEGFGGMFGMMGGGGGAAIAGGLGGMGGGFGGMGGGFGGGMGGGFGGGMGGMGFRGGGIFGGGVVPEPAADGNAGLSSGGDGQEPVETPTVPPMPVAMNDAALQPEPHAVAPPIEETYQYASDAQLELLTSSIAPESWDAMGGPGAIAFFPQTLDFVVAQTREVHQQIEALLNRLRGTPSETAEALGGRPATVHPVAVDNPRDLNLEGLVDLITTTVAVYTWDIVGGLGVLEADIPRAALVVSQTDEVHEQVEGLLTLLRRSRYEAERGGRHWQHADGAPIAPLADVVALPNGAAEPATGPIEPEELELLQVRREVPVGVWTWRRFSTGKDSKSTRSTAGDDKAIHDTERPARPASRATLTVARDERRREYRLDDCVVRTEGPLSAVAWPSLRLVELGEFGDELRRLLDAGLPWLPHLTNQELAALFHVQRTAAADEPSAGSDDLVWLRMVPAGLPRDGDTCLRIAYRRADGQAAVWQALVGGQLVARIDFPRRDDQSSDGSGQAVLLDATGREVAHWSWEESDAVPAGGIPAVTDGWQDYLVLDHGPGQQASESPLVQLLAAIRKYDWSSALEHLGRLPSSQQAHPLVQFLEALCLENAPRRGPRQRLLDRLSAVARDGSPDLVRYITMEVFPSLSAAERYAVLALQPANRRNRSDWERLCRAAADCRAWQNVLEHAEAAVSHHGEPAQGGELTQLRVRALLEWGRLDEAADVVDRWVAEQAPEAVDLAAMAEVIAAHGPQETAEGLFETALADGDPAPTMRYHLRRRLAAIRKGVARWETLLEIAESQPAGSASRLQCLVDLRRELHTTAHAEIAGRLASQTEDPELAAALRIRQAGLTNDVTLAADLLWDVYSQERLSNALLAWAVRTWYQAGQPARVIGVSERHLRAGGRLSDVAVDYLAAAYRSSGRDIDARRAASDDQEPGRRPPEQPAPMPGGMF